MKTNNFLTIGRVIWGLLRGGLAGGISGGVGGGIVGIVFSLLGIFGSIGKISIIGPIFLSLYFSFLGAIYGALVAIPIGGIFGMVDIFLGSRLSHSINRAFKWIAVGVPCGWIGNMLLFFLLRTSPSIYFVLVSGSVSGIVAGPIFGKLFKQVSI